MAQTMDRGTDALKSHLGDTQAMSMRQTRRGWLQECIGCEAKTEFKVFVGGDQIAHALEDADFCCRCCCSPIHPFTMVVKEATVTSGGQELGSMMEDCFFCVPSFRVMSPDKTALYKVHPPTCCGGCCVNCCAEGNPCFGRGCCKVPFHIFPATQEKTDDGAPFIGKIVKAPKSIATEVFTVADAFDITFPMGATPQEKGLLMGSAIFINVNFFEEKGEGE